MDTVIVTGASSGLGLETALYLAERGFKVYGTVVSASEEPAVLQAAAERHVALELLRLDFNDPATIETAVDAVASDGNGIYGLVNNAGLGLRGCFEDTSEEEMRRIYEINVFGSLSVTKRVLPIMREARRGRILSVTSIGGRIASFGLSGYCSTKFALEGFGEALSIELALFGIKSILIEPGIINTPHWTINRGTTENAYNPESPYARFFRRHESIADRIRQRSTTRPIHVAKVIHEALTVRNPRMRYIIGRPAILTMAFRRYAPGELFERIYFGFLLRRITRGA